MKFSLSKHESYGIKNNELDWFKSFLCNRSHPVHVSSVLSDFKTHKTGIPQRSILGHLLFIFFRLFTRCCNM